MSPRGHEDWGVSSSAVQASPDTPAADLAARLGALSLYDQTGQLLFADGFEHGFAPWTQQTSGLGASIVLTAGKSFIGGYSARATGGSDGNRYAGVTKALPVPFLSRWGLEGRATTQSVGGEFSLSLRHHTGSHLVHYEVRFDMATTALKVLQSDGTYATVVSSSNVDQGIDIWHPFKAIIDLDNRTYIRLLFDDQRVDLTAYSPQVTVNTDQKHIGVDIFCISRAGQNDLIDLDSVILTQNEP